MHAKMANHARQNFQWLDLLNWKTLSAEVGMIKPQRAIYEHCLRGLGVAAQETCSSMIAKSTFLPRNSWEFMQFSSYRWPS
jgi:hypothetical protein